jgi:hypothetical protein
MKLIKSKIRDYEIEKIKGLLDDPTLKSVERYNLNIYLKSLLKDDKN